MKRHHHRIEANYQPRTEQEQQQVAADALRRAATEVRRLEKLTDEQHDNGGGDRAS